MKLSITVISVSLLLLGAAGYSANLTYSGSNLYSDIIDVEFYGDYAICAMGYGLMILDISDYSSPQFVSSCYWNVNNPRGLATIEQTAFVYTDEIVYMFDFSDINNPTSAGIYNFSGNIQHILAQGNTLLVCQRNIGVTFLRFSSGNLSTDVNYPTAGYPSRITNLSGDSLFCVATTKGLEIINYNGAGFVEQYAIDSTLGQISDVTAKDDKIYAVSIYDSVLVFETPDFNDLTNVIGSFNSGSPYSILVMDTILYLGDTETGIFTYNISDPTNFSQIANASYYGKFVVRDSLLMLQRDAEIWFYDTEEQGQLNYIDKYREYNYHNDIDILGPIAYVAGRHFTVLDISQLDGDPELYGACYLGNAIGLEATGYYAYVICSDSTVKRIDAMSPWFPVVVDTLEIADQLEGIAYYNNYLYVTSSNSILYIIDVSSIHTFSVVNTIDMGLYFNEIKVRDGFLYAGKLKVYDLSDPVHPSLSGSPTNEGFTHDFTLDSIWALYTYDYPEPYMGGLTIYNVDNPTSPFFVSHITLGEETGSIAVDYPTAFLSTLFGREIYIVDISDPENPDSTSTYVSTEDNIQNFDIWSGKLYAAGSRGLTVLKYSNICGDVNGDGNINVGDPIFYVNWIFKGGLAPLDMEQADVNCDNHENIGDAVFMINYIFKGGDAPCADCPL